MPTLLGPDNGVGDMSPAHLDGILAAGGADAMTAVTVHESVFCTAVDFHELT